MVDQFLKVKAMRADVTADPITSEETQKRSIQRMWGTTLLA